jgi:arylformamidase
MGSHTGTHVDAPHHFIAGGQTVDELPLELLVGPAIVASVEPIAGDTLGVEDMVRLQLPAGIVRLVLKTRNSAFWHDRTAVFRHNYVHLGPDAARWVVEQGIRVLGIDYLSVEGFDVPEPVVHRTLLGAGVVILEGLDLSQVPAGPCQLVCLPLKIEGGDGAPARVLIARERANLQRV